MLSDQIFYDTATRLIHVDRPTILTVDDVNAYIRRLGAVIADARAFGPVRVLADFRQSVTRTQAAAGHLRQFNLMAYRPGDRVALVTDSSVLRLQFKRNQVEGLQQLFATRDEATRWLASD